MKKAVSRYQVGEWTIDPQRGLARCQGRNVHLEPKATELLNHLVSRSGEVVSRDELLDVVWPDVTVGDEVITNTIAKLRRALEGDPDLPKLIETIPKRGYRIVASIGEVSAATTSNRLSQWFWIVTLMATLAVVGTAVFLMRPWTSIRDTASIERLTPPVREKPSIAVLPFTNMSDDKEQEYFSDGMTEDLITDLSRISSLTVISRTSSFAYKGRSPDVRDLATELGVSHVIEGSVRKVGGRVRINAQLIDVATGAHLWAERYDRELKDIFALQDEVRGKIVSALAIKLASDEGRLVALKGTESVEAYDLLLRGRHQESFFTREGNAEAIQFYEKAIATDPGYANAYARLANMYDIKVRYGWSVDVEKGRSKALQLARKAVALDGNNPFSHWTNGRIISRHGPKNIENQYVAISSLERALKLDPDYADAYAFISLLYIGIGKPDKALAAMESATKLRPQHPFWYFQNQGIIHYLHSHYNDAIVDFEKAAKRNPTALFVRWWLAASYAQAGLQDDADWQLEELKGLGFQSTVREIVEASSTIQHSPYKELFAEGLRKAGISK